MTQNRPVAVITGGSSGIGKACAITLANRYEVWITFSRHAANAQLVAQEISALGGTAFPLHLDFTDPCSVQSAYEAFASHYQKHDRAPILDLLVTSAGSFGEGYRLLDEIDEQEWDELWTINVDGPLRLIRQFEQLFAPGSLVINISSIVAHLGAIGYKSQAHYAVTKAAFAAMISTYTTRSPTKGLQTVNLLPGLIDTGMLRHHLGNDYSMYIQAIPLGQVGTAEHIAQVVTFLTSRNGTAINGTEIIIDGGWSQSGWRNLARMNMIRKE